jgi:peroxiredoxin Q/BCP
VVIGISTDNLSDQQKFAKKENLNFALLADNDKKAAKAFGVLMAKYDKKYAQRVTFVIDKQGIIRKIYPKVDIGKHPDEVLAYIGENLK